MRRNILILTILIFSSSCTKNLYNKDLLGSWSNIPMEGKSQFTFYKDSLVVLEYSEKSTAKWKASKNRIYISPINSSLNFKKNDTLHYKFNDTKDSLFIKSDTVISNKFFPFIKHK